jgi:hypothetical protein
MRRIEIVAAFDKVLTVLRESGLSAMGEELFSGPGRDINKKNIVNVFMKYIELIQGFGATELRIMEDIDLINLNNPDFWTSLITSEDARTTEFFRFA